jgi:hypothetical protein
MLPQRHPCFVAGGALASGVCFVLVLRLHASTYSILAHHIPESRLANFSETPKYCSKLHGGPHLPKFPLV